MPFSCFNLTILILSIMPYLFSVPENILQKYEGRFDLLPTFFEGDSRILKETEDSNYLIGKLKPTIFSLEANGPIPLEGIDIPRTQLNQSFCSYLHSQGIKTSTVSTKGDLILMTKEKVAPIEVVVKSAHVGSPKHIYKNMDQFTTRSGPKILPGREHAPYVRFDWRNPLPDEDLCMPEGLADYFVDTTQAKETVLRAYHALNNFLKAHDFNLVDICFFMNETGDTICAEISTDNTRIEYIGTDQELKFLFESREKNKAIFKAQALLNSLETSRILISGPFCTGKTTLIKRVIQELSIPKLIDDATRPKRAGERDNFPYHFITKEEFEKNIENNDYYEWINFNGNYYGVPKDKIYLQRTWIMDILSSSLPHYKERIPGLVSIYLQQPPEHILVERARSRGDSEENIRKRLEALKDEDPTHYDYVIPDVNLDEKFRILKMIINKDPESERYKNQSMVNVQLPY